MNCSDIRVMQHLGGWHPSPVKGCHPRRDFRSTQAQSATMRFLTLRIKLIRIVERPVQQVGVCRLAGPGLEKRLKRTRKNGSRLVSASVRICPPSRATILKQVSSARLSTLSANGHSPRPVKVASQRSVSLSESPPTVKDDTSS